MAKHDGSSIKAFHEILHEHLNYEAGKIPFNKIQKIFEDPRTGPYMNDLAKTIRGCNIPLREEFSIYKKLHKTGKVKTGTDLEYSIRRSSKMSRDLESEISDLDYETEYVETEILRLKAESEKLDEIKSTLAGEQEQVLSAVLESEHHLQEKKDSTQDSCENVKDTLKNLTENFSKLCKVIQNVSGQNCLFAQMHLEKFIEVQEKYLVSLTSFVKKYLHEVTSSYMIDVMETSDEELHGKDEVIDALERALQCNPDCMKRLFEAQLEDASADAVLSFYEKYEQGEVNSTPLDWMDDKTGNHNIDNVKQELEQFRIKIPGLISQVTSLLKSHLLLGDYLSKIAYQNYILGKQKEVLKALDYQKEILDIMSILLAGEEAGHKETGKNVLCLIALLRTITERGISEAERYQKVAEETTPVKRTIFDSKDTVPLVMSACLSENASSSESSFPFLYFDDLPKSSQKLTERLNGLKTIFNKFEMSTKSLAGEVTKCWNMVIPADQEPSEDPADDLTPRAVREATNELQKRVNELMNALQSSSDEIQRKKRFLNQSKSAEEARSLWVEFYSQPDNGEERSTED